MRHLLAIQHRTTPSEGDSSRTRSTNFSIRQVQILENFTLVIVGLRNATIRQKAKTGRSIAVALMKPSQDNVVIQGKKKPRWSFVEATLK